jgi:hypothetical protein
MGMTNALLSFATPGRATVIGDGLGITDGGDLAPPSRDRR